MSTRLYPLYQRGNPQLRVFLPNFYMYIVRPAVPQPSNVVTFHCSMKMTEFDIKNYLEKIYKLPVKSLRMDIEMGETRKSIVDGYIVKDEDVKIAYVTLGDNETFRFPNLFPKEKEQSTTPTKEIDALTKEYNKATKRFNNRPYLPSWFTI